MSKKRSDRPSDVLQSADAAVAGHFQRFRDAARDRGPLDRATVELILLAGFAANGHEVPFKNHARRALAAGTSKEALQHAVLVTLGATSVMAAVTLALGWIEDVIEERGAEPR